MKTNITNLLRIFCGLSLGLVLIAGAANAQSTAANNAAKSTEPKKTDKVTETTKTVPKKTDTSTPTSATTGEDAGNYTITSSMEFGYRGQRVDGDVNKFKSDLNYKAGPRLFDSSFYMKSKNGKGDLFDTMMVTSTGWGADPYGNMRISVENPEWYRFEGTYRRFKYYRFLNNIANPNWLFSPIPTPPNPATGLHGYNTRTEMGDFDLTILPKNEMIRFSVGYSPERYSGPSYTNYHNGGNEFWLLNNLKSKADDFRFGADGRFGQVDWTFLQGFRRFKEDSVIPAGIGLNVNTTSTVAQLTSFLRQEPTRGSIDYTRFTLHSLIDKKLDITGRVIYSTSTTNSTYLETFAGRNFNFRISNPVFPPTPPTGQPNTVNPSSYNIASQTKRPSHVIDFGLTYLASDKFRFSNTFRQEAFTIDGFASFSDFFSLTRSITGGTRTDTFSVTNLPAIKTTHYSRISDTLEGDYQFNPRYSMHFGYRYGHRSDIVQLGGYLINSNAPALASTAPEIEENTTHAFFGGFKARPAKNFTLYFDAEHGTADNVFTRIGNYNYTNVRAKTRWSPKRTLAFNFAFILRDNSNPSEIAGVSLRDFGVNLKTRVFTSSVDWMPNSNITVNGGYNYNWVNSSAIVDYFFQVPPATSVRHPEGLALYYQRLNYFFLDVVARLNHRMTLYTSYRINQDGGQGSRRADPAGTPGTLITSYPMNFQSPEARLAIKLNRHFDWNLGYQYYAYNESNLVNTFPASVRPQNYHAHLPYMSLRLYFGRKE